MSNIYRDVTLNQVSEQDIGKTIRVAGWVENIRDHGGVSFIDLRDMYAVMQIVIRDGKLLEGIRKEQAITVEGLIEKRDEETYNPKIPTGTIELDAKEVTVLGEVYSQLPFEVMTSKSVVHEDVRLKYRYLDLRNQKVKDNIIFRSKVISYLREKMTSMGFLELQTPILCASSPEAWEEYWRWDEDDTNVAVYYNTKDKPCGFMVYLIKNDIMHIKEMIYLNREAKKGLWEYIHAHDSMIDAVHGYTYFSEPIAFEMDDGDIKETIRPYAMGRIIDIESFLQDYPCDPDGGTLYIELEIEDHLLLWNNRSFRLCFSDGKCMLTDEPAEYKLKMEIGTLTTLLLGYKTAERLYALERIEGKQEAVDRLDDVLFHKIPYISDYI